jgi:hypothetical protein
VNVAANAPLLAERIPGAALHLIAAAGADGPEGTSGAPEMVPPIQPEQVPSRAGFTVGFSAADPRRETREGSIRAVAPYQRSVY